MTQYYYSTQPILSWCFNHYFYNGVHFAFVGAPFYPYRLSNPRTSSSMRVYEDYYEPWKDEDDFSGFIAQKRLSLRKGVHIHATGTLRGELLRICRKIDIAFFFPIVYRIDIDGIQVNDPNRYDLARARLQKGGSALKAPGKCEKPSNEYVLKDLREKQTCDDVYGDFDLLFLDLEVEITLQDNYIQLLTQLLAPGEVVPAREVTKLNIYHMLKTLYEDRTTLTTVEVLTLLKQYC